MQLLGIRFPIIQAPMAGGPTTPALVAAVTNAGGLGSFGAAYSSVAQIDDAVAEIRKGSSGPFALNLFAGAPADVDPRAVERVEPLLSEFRRELGIVGPPPPAPAPDPFDLQFEAVLRAQPRLFSFTFGTPTREQVRALRERSIVSMGTATTLDEGEALMDLSIDTICAQGAEAGGHRGTFLGRFEDGLVGTLALVAQLVKLPLPIVAAGGIMDGRGIAAALALGAQGAQLGTAFMLCPEAGTSPAHRAALTSGAARRTVITAAFSGRPARGIRNRFTDAFAGVDVPAFPKQQELTRDIRSAATKQERTDLMQLWAGQGAPLIRALPAAEIMQALVLEAGF
jgi:nitronate monooxygenase